MDAACTGSNTCDLVAKECVNVAPGSVQNCVACTNDEQCAAGHRCIAMDFEGSPHGHFCLAEPAPTCAQPFAVGLNKPSINGAPAATYCGIEEDLATCEAVRSLVNNWYCTGTEAMCSQLQGGNEVPVPGALCRQVGLLGLRCTYACGTASECPSTGPPASCGGSPTPTWCGG
jgi:hypothetical protein